MAIAFMPAIAGRAGGHGPRRRLGSWELPCTPALPRRWRSRSLLLAGAALTAQAGVYLYTTARGKLRVWERELDRLALHGDEYLLDLGCGRGAVLVAAAGGSRPGVRSALTYGAAKTKAATRSRQHEPTRTRQASLAGSSFT